MGLQNFISEQGFEIEDGGAFLTGSGAPLGTSGPTDLSLIGSFYGDTSAGLLWQKKTSTSSASDWIRVTDETIYTALGITYGDTDMGTYTGGIISDNVAQAAVNQELETAIEAISGGSTTEDNVPAATPTALSPCLVDNCNGVEWEVCAFEQASEGTKEFFKFTVLHDGTSVADATLAGSDWSSHTKLKTANIGGLTFSPVFTGTGAAQTVSLEISATAAITVKIRRTAI